MQALDYKHSITKSVESNSTRTQEKLSTYINPKQGYVGEDYVEILAPTDRNGNQIFETKVYKFQINVGH
ncbi:hypothetical protein GCM10009433_05650 [Psychroflexus lacisalsi]|uniref:Uncharacterized protein n=1 Tax=Psychroflexus lacisalsi TaxID=503928 RepID=A0ABP3VFC0_9FLAO